MAVVRFGRHVEEYTAGWEFCITCARTRRHQLVVRSWRLELPGVALDLGRRHWRQCRQCGRAERLVRPPGPAELAEWANEAAAETQPGRDELFERMSRRMGYLLSPVGADEREAVLAGAQPGVHGILLEYARHQVREALRELMAGWTATGGPLDPRALEAALEQELFNSCQAGYVAHAVVQYVQSGAPPRRGATVAADEFARVVVPRATGRAERARAAVLADVAAFIFNQGDAAPDSLARRGHPVPPRLAGAVARAARACLYFGYAVAAEEALLTR